MALIYIVEDDKNIQEIEMFALKNIDYAVEGFEMCRRFLQKAVRETSGPCVVRCDASG